MKFVRSFLSNLTSLLLALVLAVVVWATAVRANDPFESRFFEIEVRTIGLAPNSELVGRPTETARILLEGPTSVLDEIDLNDYLGIIDLSSVASGEETLPIQVQGDFESVELLDTVPDSAVVRVEQIVTREIPVQLIIRGDVARGHRIGSERVEPDNVVVTGPAPRVDQLAEARVTYFLDDSREDISETRRPTFYDVSGNVAGIVGLDVSPAEVEIIIPVIELAGFAEKPITVDWIGEPAPGYRLLDLRVDPVSAQVTGLPSAIEDLRLQTEQVDISGLTQTETRPVTLDLPEGVSLVDVQPFLVTVEIEPILSSGLVERPVEIRALAKGLTATLTPEEVRVFMFGPLPIIDSLAEDDVRATVDLLGLEVGTHVLEPFVSIAADEVVVRSTQPAVITVVISDVITATEGITDTVETITSDLLPAAIPKPDIQPGSESLLAQLSNRLAFLPGYRYLLIART
jgi:YbbR domain-containing protein